MKNVITVVVTYNRKDLLKEGLEALLSSEYKDNKIIIVDNASTDGTKEMLEAFIDNKKVFYFNTGSNKGGSFGFSYGSKKAIEMGCDYVWLMDDDCIVKKDSLTKLVDFAKSVNDDFGYLSSKVLWKDGSMCFMNIPKYNIAKRIKDFDKTQKICIASFVSCFIKEEAIEDVGLSMSDFFIWGDDWEYTYRIFKKYPCYYVSDSIVLHKSKTNNGVNIVNADDKMLPRYRYAYRNESYFYHQVGFKGRLYLFFKVLLHTFRVLFKKCDKKFLRLKYIYKYTFEGAHFYPRVEYAFRKGKELNVLEYFGEPLSFGGQEAFMINMYSCFKDKDIHYTFATPFEATNSKLISLISERGDTLVHFDHNFESRKRKKWIIKSLKSVLKDKHYDVIHIQSGSIFTLCNCAKIAKKYGIKKIIVHSHATGNNNFKYRLIKHYSDKRIKKYTTYFFACSQLAGEWKFPESVIKNNELIVIKNGIDTNKYRFSSSTRNEIREKLNIKENEITFLHVGRFDKYKNHAFILELLNDIKEKYPDFRFILVGEGETKENFEKAVSQMGLLDHFIFLQGIDYVNEVMMASDVFLFPSLLEGLPMALIESQATGLLSICSDSITKEVGLTSLLTFLPLEKEAWLTKIDENIAKLGSIDRKKYADIIKNSGFDAKNSASILENMYTGRYE